MNALNRPVVVQPSFGLADTRMLTLRLFGGLSLTDSEGVVPARATQPRRLALLAIVAVGADRPTSRDKLLGGMGVVGPTRMDYPGTMAAVLAVAGYVGEILTSG